MPSLGSLEDATWRKGLSPRKSSASAMHLGFRPAPRMITASTSMPRKNAIISPGKDDHLHADNVGPAVFLGRGMSIYVDGEDEMVRDSDIPTDVAGKV